MQINGPLNVVSVQQLAPDKNWGVVALIPRADDGVNASVLGSENFGLTTSCKDVDAGVEFLTWLMSKEVSANFCAVVGKFSPRYDSPPPPLRLDRRGECGCAVTVPDS